MKDLETDFQGWHGLFGVCFKKNYEDLVKLVKEDPELGRDLKHVEIPKIASSTLVRVEDWPTDNNGMVLVRLNLEQECQAVFTDYRSDMRFLADSDLRMSGDELLDIRNSDYSLLMYTLTSKSKEQNCRVRDRVLGKFTDIKDVGVYKSFKEHQSRVLEKVCGRRYSEELINLEPIEISGPRYSLAWQFYCRKRTIPALKIIRQHPELKNNIVQAGRDPLGLGLTYLLLTDEGRQVSIILAEPTYKLSSKEYISRTGESFSDRDYCSLSITAISSDRKLSMKYLKRMEQLFADHDLTNIKESRYFVDVAMKHLNEQLIERHEREE